MNRLVLLALCLCTAAAPAAEPKHRFDKWPPRDFLVESLVAQVPKLLARYHPETGKFGSGIWVYNDQMAIFPLAAAWAIQHERNPYYHDAKLMPVIARGGEVWLEQMDDKAMFRLERKNGDFWGMHRSAFVTAHWVKTYCLVKDALPEASRKKWEEGLLRTFKFTSASTKRAKVHNLPLRHAMALYIGGVAFEREDWKQTAKAFMARAASEQDPAGFWSEHSGPVVLYNTAYPWFLGIYYHFSQDPVVRDALERVAKFHVNLLWPDGTFVSCIDERTIYSKRVHIGNPGFAASAEGRAFLLNQLRIFTKNGRRHVEGEYAANMLLYTTDGPVAPMPTDMVRNTVAIGDNDAIVRRHKPWQWALSGYTCPPYRSRWIQDRQSFIDVFHDQLGLVIGGGNTKLQPYWSTFTVGDPSLIKFTVGDTKPNFTPKVDLQWTPDAATLTTTPDTTSMRLKYGKIACRAHVSANDDGSLKLTFAAPAGQRVEAHLPLLCRSKQLILASGEKLRLGKGDIRLSAEQIGGHFLHGDLKVTVPKGASLRWPAWQHNPYRKSGQSSISNAKLVLVMPFDQVTEYAVTLSHCPRKPFKGIAFDARDLKNHPSKGVGTKPIHGLAIQFVNFVNADGAIAFTLPPVKPGRYELLGEFCMAHSYCIVQVSLDGKAVGKPFDAYCEGVDSVGERVPFGKVTLDGKAHKITVQPVGKNAKATQMFIGVKRWLLRPLGK